MLHAAMSVALASAPSAVELTVYNQGFALVKEQRELNLTKGVQEVTVEDVAQRIESNSVGISSLTAPGSISVLEQNYRFDLISPMAILNKAVGGRITLRRVLPNGQKEEVSGTLLSAPSAVFDARGGSPMTTYQGMVLRTDAGAIILDPTGEVEVSSIPEGLISKPSLVWTLESSRAGVNNVLVSYLAQGISWNADYVLSLDKNGTLGDLKGWVTLNNQSGGSFKNAKLKLLAGEVFRPQPSVGGFGGGGGRMLAEAALSKASMDQEAFAEYHLYTSARPVTVRNNELKQVSLLEGTGFKVVTKIVLDATRNAGQWRAQEEGAVGQGNIKPLVFVEFSNKKEEGLGMPMPAGNVKVFQRDSSDSLQMLGEAQIDHTPRDEKLSLLVGRSFDVVADRKRTNFEWLSRRSRNDGTREAFEIEIRNRKEVPSTVSILERAWGEWKVITSSDPFTKKDSNTFEFLVTLKPNEVKKLTWTLETYWP